VRAAWLDDGPRTAKLTLFDVHGTGAQRSDPKAGDANDFPEGRGPRAMSSASTTL